MKKTHYTLRKQGKVNEQELTAFFTKNGQHLLLMLDLIEQSRMACDQLIDVIGRASARPSCRYPPRRWREGHSSKAKPVRGAWSLMADKLAM